MSRREDADVPPGLLLVDKPGGMTSHDVVARARRVLSVRRVGHAGTLDPMATGLLVLGVGAATRLLGYVGGHDKTYEATLRLGQATVTDDRDLFLPAGRRCLSRRCLLSGYRRPEQQDPQAQPRSV